MRGVILGVTGPHEIKVNLVNIFTNPDSLKILALGILFGMLLAAGHFYSLRLTVQWSFNAPRWGSILVMLLYFLRFAILAVLLYLVIHWGGYAVSIGILIGVTISQVLWVLRQNSHFNRMYVRKHNE